MMNILLILLHFYFCFSMYFIVCVCHSAGFRRRTYMKEKWKEEQNSSYIKHYIFTYTINIQYKNEERRTN